ncbi:MAG TPA: outer membrane protein assembly factor BamA [Gammaproteobacteria bacterium]
MRTHGLIRRLLVCTALLLVAQGARAADAFVVTDIEMTGLHRISDGTVLNYLPVREGDTVTAEDIRLAVRSLFRAGFFTDIRVRRDGGTLIFDFDERPTIASFEISGNKEIETEQLENILREQGLAEGRIFNASTFEAMETELERVYQGRGKYNVIVTTEEKELPNNLVEVSIDIKEGLVSRIAGINIVGNEIFPDERIEEELTLKESHFWSWLAADDKYSREALVGDLEAMRSFYYDQGYADFETENVQVSLSPDKRDVFLSIGIREGEVYTVAESQLRGELIVPQEQLEGLILLKPGERFSMRMAEAGSQLMVRRLEAEGYAFAEVEAIPEVDRENKTVAITYFVNPGRRAYVRSIVFNGAPGTNDEVFRREMRVFEGAWLNNARLERSKVRLERLPFVESATVKTEPVPDSPDVVDVIFDIKERNAGEFQIGVGYAGSTTGVMGNISVSHTNFLGTGDKLDFTMVSSSFQRSLSITHRDPYATDDGISRSLSVFYVDSSALGRRLEDFNTVSYGGGVDYTYPISEYSSIGWGVSASRNETAATRPGISRLVEEFLVDPAHGDVTITPLLMFGSASEQIKLAYDELSISGRYIHDTRNRSIFATRGSRRQVSAILATNPGDIEYYQALIEQRNFFPLGGGFTLTTNIDLAVAEPLGDTNVLPPGKRFLAGGFDTIRGFRESYLGPFDDNVFDEDGELVRAGTGYPVGGRLRTFFQTELLLPKFTGDDPEAPPENSQFSVFIDTGYVFETVDDFDFDEFRVSAGVAGTFLTPVGAMRFSVGVPIIEKEGDELERIQFTIGSVF